MWRGGERQSAILPSVENPGVREQDWPPAAVFQRSALPARGGDWLASAFQAFGFGSTNSFGRVFQALDRHHPRMREIAILVGIGQVWDRWGFGPSAAGPCSFVQKPNARGSFRNARHVLKRGNRPRSFLGSRFHAKLPARGCPRLGAGLRSVGNQDYRSFPRSAPSVPWALNDSIEGQALAGFRRG